MGKSGVNSAKLLVTLGAQVIVNDKTDQPNQSQVDELKKIGV